MKYHNLQKIAQDLSIGRWQEGGAKHWEIYISMTALSLSGRHWIGLVVTVQYSLRSWFYKLLEHFFRNYHIHWLQVTEMNRDVEGEKNVYQTSSRHRFGRYSHSNMEQIQVGCRVLHYRLPQTLKS